MKLQTPCYCLESFFPEHPTASYLCKCKRQAQLFCFIIGRNATEISGLILGHSRRGAETAPFRIFSDGSHPVEGSGCFALASQRQTSPRHVSPPRDLPRGSAPLSAIIRSSPASSWTFPGHYFPEVFMDIFFLISL